MTKFEDANDDGFLKVSGELRRYIEVAKQASPNARLDVDEQATMHFTVPYSSNENFIGRIDILRQLESCFNLSNINRTWQPRIALYGLGGIGKTQIAIQFTYWLRHQFPDMAVYWVHASNADRFRQSFTSIAQECGIPGLDDPEIDVLPLVKAWLGKKDNGRWLMVIDNADDEALFTTHQQTSTSSSRSSGNLGGFIPDCANGNILITTRNKKAGSRLTKGKQLIEIGKMDVSDCVKLLHLQLDDSASTESVGRLSEQLEYIPLALVQAAAFIRENAVPIDYYLELLMERPVDLLGEEFEAVGRDEESLHAVATTWMISFQQIQQRNPLAGEFLSLMAFFDRQEIPRSFLLNYYERRNDGKDGVLEVTKAIGLLLSFCLIREEASQNITIHRLVQMTTRKWLSIQRHEDAYKGEALSTVLEMFPDRQSVENRGWRNNKGRSSHQNWRLLREEGRSKEAEEAHKEAGTIYREILGEEDHNTLTSMGDLALIWWDLARFEEAEKLLIKVIELRKRVLGDEHPDTIISMGNLAQTIYGEAEKLQTKVLDLCKRFRGEEHPETLIGMNNLAQTIRDLGRLGEAEKLQTKVLDLCKRFRGEEHSETLRAMGNLAQIISDLGRLGEAEKLQTKVLDLCKRVHGEEHPATLNSMNHLAHTWRKLGRPDEAIEMIMECMELQKRILGEHHPRTLSSIKTLRYWLSLPTAITNAKQEELA
ncbi:unnamed protein product [Clonostachys rosea f. rosea IK726]|uniref:Uncharacterized protein n=1 Tax=Clonostachys rosea f. rosea IK726 TaxID=1349383 RepID=A0ACA9U9I9_BIOOC|nr:unnamed protein product [Clonostachys rosea f. rosea IK726]